MFDIEESQEFFFHYFIFKKHLSSYALICSEDMV